MRYRWTVAFAVLVAAGVLGSAFIGPGGVENGGDPPREQLLQPGQGADYVWPYTSRSQSIDGRTLALNVVIVGTPAEVRAVLTDQSELEWAAAESDQGLNESVSVSQLDEPVSISPWRSARGAARYTYVAERPGSGEWVESDYQLATGTYLGSRTHIRAYPGPSDNWTALQAHTEYWDWFRLRHSVTGIAEGSRTVERDLRDERFVDEVSRVYHGHAGGGSDGWISVIRLTSATDVSPGSIDEAPGPGSTLGLLSVVPAVAVLAAAVPPVRRRDLWDAALPLSIVVVVLGVRSVGIAAEGLFPAANPKIFAGVLYPMLVVGPLLATALLARGRPATRMALLAAAGLGAGFVLDLSGVGVRTVPIRLVLHRTALVGVIGLFALGVASEERRVASAGAVLWVAILAATLLGMV
ncbi:hypothetical protein [Halobellus rarus]|uniref:Uncharacterized protein n=1 Tax=Halobellus rarus TaxID=1126237 RepID=A0ABD6CLS1_9EURY|nr:hypothetical protein [Halobellus rarus]